MQSHGPALEELPVACLKAEESPFSTFAVDPFTTLLEEESGAEKDMSAVLSSTYGRTLLTVVVGFLKCNGHWWRSAVFQLVQPCLEDRNLFLQNLCASSRRAVRVLTVAFPVCSNAWTADWPGTVTPLV